MKMDHLKIMIVCVAAFLVTGGFVLFYPINGEIVQGKPFLKFICFSNLWCEYGPSRYYCEVGLNIEEDHPLYTKLTNWKGFQGCNESTNGFEEGSVLIETCHCSFFG
jgi:hypothetical protein